MAQEIIVKEVNHPSFIFCYWDDIIFISEDKNKQIKEK
tara:strand:+ start:104 stop:217 length:114 start_codon:yes stop_codon:yes gene_type:complete